ncbi:MAG: hypothetical protein AAFW81_09030 [Pseudomonadota bacterium]
MKRVLSAFICLAVLTGCATTGNAPAIDTTELSAIETRLDQLETKQNDSDQRLDCLSAVLSGELQNEMLIVEPTTFADEYQACLGAVTDNEN